MKACHTFGLYQQGNRLYTQNLTPGKRVYGEDLVKGKGKEYREWNPRKSKWGAYAYKGARDIFLRENQTVLYLGVASGTTASHVSDILRGGMVYGVDPFFRPMMQLVLLAEKRKNIAPLLANASLPDSYEQFLPKQVDIVFQDIAQRDQTYIFMKNVDKYLKKGGFGLLSIKARSIDVTKRPKIIFQEVKRELERKYTLVDMKTLEPFEKDHAMIVIKK